MSTVHLTAEEKALLVYVLQSFTAAGTKEKLPMAEDLKERIHAAGSVRLVPKEHEDWRGCVDSLDQRHRALVERFDLLARVNSELSRRLAQCEDMSAAPQRIADIERRLDRHDGSRDGLVERLDKVEARFDAIAGVSAEVSATFTAMESRLECHSENLESLSKRLDVFGKRLDGYGDVINTIREEVSNRLDLLSAGHTKLADDLTRCEQRLPTMRDLTGVDGRLCQLTDVVRKLKERWIHQDNEGVKGLHARLNLIEQRLDVVDKAGS